VSPSDRGPLPRQRAAPFTAGRASSDEAVRLDGGEQTGEPGGGGGQDGGGVDALAEDEAVAGRGGDARVVAWGFAHPDGGPVQVFSDDGRDILRLKSTGRPCGGSRGSPAGR
jgi:hypothetical protein